MAGKEFIAVAGTKARASDINNYMLQKVAEDDTAGSHDTSTYTLISPTISIDANNINNHIIIHLNVGGDAERETDGDDATPFIDIRIGETGSVVSKMEHEVISVNANPASGIVNVEIREKGLVFYYAPTTDEKANGFDIEIYGKVTETGTADGTAYYHRMVVTGA